MAYFLLNKKGTKVLVDKENYMYKILNKQGNSVYWRCSEYRTRQCSGITKTHGFEHPIPLIPGQHSHPSNIGKVEFLKAEAELVKAAVDNPTLPPRVLLGEMSNRMAGIDSRLPKSGQAFLKSVQRARVKSGGIPKAPSNYEEAVTLIPDSFRLTKSHERFLRFAGQVEDMEEPTMMLFMSPLGKELLRKADIWFADGTFHTAPFPFSQVKNNVSKYT